MLCRMRLRPQNQKAIIYKGTTMKSLHGLLICLLVLSKSLSAEPVQSTTPSATTQGKSVMGTEFIFTMPPYFSGTDSSGSVFLQMNAESDGLVTVKFEGKGWQVSKVIKAFTQCIVEIPASFVFPFTKPNNSDYPLEQVWTQSAIIVNSTVPIHLSSNYRLSTNAQGESIQVFPVQNLGLRYNCESLADMSWMYGTTGASSQICICGVEDNTQVSFTMGGPSVTVSPGKLRPGQTTSFTLNRGDVWIIGTSFTSKEGDLSGSIVSANHPVAVISGCQCANVPSTLRWCNYTAEMQLPMERWEKEYIVPRYNARGNGYFMKIFAAESNTKVSYNCSYYKTIQSVGGREGLGWIYQRVDGAGNNLVNISGDKAIGITVYNPGIEDDDVASMPFSMQLIPTQRFYTEVQFVISNDARADFSNQIVGIQIPLDAQDAIPASLEFGQLTNGQMQWTTFSSAFGSTYTKSDVYPCLSNGRRWIYREIKLKAGSYAMRCPLPFMCYTYGGDKNAAFGRAVGVAGNSLLQDLDSIAPTIHSTQSGTMNYGVVTDLPNDSTLRSNLKYIRLQNGSANYKLTTPTISGITTVSTTFSLDVIDTKNDAHAILEASDNAGNISTKEYSYSSIEVARPQIIMSPTTTLCEGATVTLRSSKTGYKSYQWSDGDSTTSITRTFNNSGRYAFVLHVVTPQGATFSTDTVFVVVNPQPVKPTLHFSNDSVIAPVIANVVYSWYYNNQILLEATKLSSIRAVAAGRYKVQVVDRSSGCSAVSDELVVGTVDVTDNDDAYRCYPNPSHDELIVECAENIRSIRISSVLGSVQEIECRGGNTMHINLGSLAIGSYVIWVQTEHHTMVRRFEHR